MGNREQGNTDPSRPMGTTIEETWLCTHCGTPYTRKVRQEKELLPDHRADLPYQHSVGHSVERLLDQRVVHQETVVPASKAGRSVERLLEPVTSSGNGRPCQPGRGAWGGKTSWNRHRSSGSGRPYQ